MNHELIVSINAQYPTHMMLQLAFFQVSSQHLRDIYNVGVLSTYHSSQVFKQFNTTHVRSTSWCYCNIHCMVQFYITARKTSKHWNIYPGIPQVSLQSPHLICCNKYWVTYNKTFMNIDRWLLGSAGMFLSSSAFTFLLSSPLHCAFILLVVTR